MVGATTSGDNSISNAAKFQLQMFEVNRRRLRI
jgi:hypothetical protein